MSVLEIINGSTKKENKFILPIKVTPMNASQEQALKEVEKNTLTTVIGAAGTGKSSTITAIASHFIMTGRKVLIVSKSDHAVDVVCNKLNNLGAGLVAMRGGKKESQKELASRIMDLLEGKIDLNNNEKSNIIKYLFNQKEEEAKRLLKTKRNNALMALLSNQDNRKNLLIQAKSAATKKKSQRDKIMATIDFKPILEAIPCFCVTTGEISDVLPLEKELFDLVICDESSEVDIASFLPCAFRAKRACVVGDEKQLKSLNFMEQKKNKSFLTKYEVSADLQLVWDYAKNSLFDFCQYYTDKCIMLNEQYRMPENVFKFNNDMFYGGMIKSAKQGDINALKKVFVNGETDKNKTLNIKEAEAIIKELKRWLKENKNNNKTIAILSMFKAQVNLITKMIEEEIKYSEIEKHNIHVGTANTAQGAEWDVILISWVIDNECKHQSLTFACNPERLNVITSRCREQVINYYSKNNIGDCLLGKYLGSIEE
jgi:superfamily I DNA and/or RNA helicase